MIVIRVFLSCLPLKTVVLKYESTPPHSQQKRIAAAKKANREKCRSIGRRFAKSGESCVMSKIRQTMIVSYQWCTKFAPHHMRTTPIVILIAFFEREVRLLRMGADKLQLLKLIIL